MQSAGGFAQPLPKKPHIPQPVPLEQLDARRQAEYGELIKVNRELEGKLPDAPDAPAPAPRAAPPAPAEPPSAPEPDAPAPWEPTPDDKKNFIRSILGGKLYEKSYKLFGSVDAMFGDRDVPTTEKMYEQLEEDGKDGPLQKVKIATDEQWEVWAERYMLAATLRKLAVGPGKPTEYPPPDNFHDRYQELAKLPRPLYQALMEAARIFELHMRDMVAKARDDSFWKTGGAN